MIRQHALGLRIANTLLAFCVGQTPITAQTAKPLAKDPFGYKLPSRVIARMGTGFFRHPERINAVALSPDGKLLAAGGQFYVSLWDTTTPRLLHKIRIAKSGDFFARLQFSPDAKMLIATKSTRLWHPRTSFWDTATGKEITRFGTKANIAAVSPDGKLVAVQHYDVPRYFINLHASQTGKIICPLQGLNEAASDIKFSRDGTKLYVLTRSGKRTEWNVATGAHKHLHNRWPRKIGTLLSANATYAVATNHPQPSFSIYSMPSGKLLHSFSREGSFLAMSPDEKTVAAGTIMGYESDNGKPKVRFWDTTTGKEVGHIIIPVPLRGPAGFSGDGKKLAVAHYSRAGIVQIWNVRREKMVSDLAWHDEAVGYLAFSPDGKRLISASHDGVVHEWEVATGRHVRQICKTWNSMRGLALSPDGNLAAVESNGLRLFDRSKKVEIPLRRKGHFHAALLLTPWGKKLLAMDVDAQKRLAKVSKTTLLRDLVTTDYVSVSPDGRSIATVGKAQVGMLMASGLPIFGPVGPLRIWDSPTGKLLRQVNAPTPNRPFKFAPFGGRSTHFWAFGWSPDGRQYYWRDGKRFKLFEAATGMEFSNVSKTLKGRFVRLSPDGRTLALAVSENEVRLLDMQTGHDYGTSALHSSELSSLIFSPTGDHLAAGGKDGSILVWDVRGFGVPEHRVKQITPQQWPRLWDDLSKDAAAAHAAMNRLLAQPQVCLPLLEKKLRHYQPPPTCEHINRLLWQLDNKRFAVRQKAELELKKLAALAQPMMREVLKKKLSLEMHLRVQLLLNELEKTPAILPPHERRLVRVLVLLEQIGSPAARPLATHLSRRLPEPVVRRRAEIAVERLRAVNRQPSK